MPELIVRPGHPDFLDLPWEEPLDEWHVPNLVELPKGISRHTVRFVVYGSTVYAIKELPLRPARQDYNVLRALESKRTPSVTPVALIEDRSSDEYEERAAAIITQYVPYSFSYREVLHGPGFGSNREKMLDAFAGLLVELHLAGCFWGDCSLSNVLYRWDAGAIETIMVDAETASIYDELSDGQREEDLELMRWNVAGGMADIAAQAGISLDDADLSLGDEIADRYESLWHELQRTERIGADEQYRITERLHRLNELGFNIDEMDLIQSAEGNSVSIRVQVGGRNFHRDRLRNLTGIEALDFQARHILADLYYHQARAETESQTGKAVAAIQWRVSQFEPMINRIKELDPDIDPIQGYCDFLNHRYLVSAEAGRDIGTEIAFDSWVEQGRPGFDVPVEDD